MDRTALAAQFTDPRQGLRGTARTPRRRARFLPWWSSPKLSVPEVDPPTDGRTSWDFRRLDEFTEVAEHFERIGRWYIDGGFTDQFGVRHESGRADRFAYWEVLCEPDVGHELSPEAYTRFYDAVVERLRVLDPEMKFVGLSLSPVNFDSEYFWHFLDPANHKDGIPLDAFSYHFYATPQILDPVDLAGNAPFEEWPGVFFAQADGFLRQVQLIESIKRRLSPGTETHINEVGTFAPDVVNPDPEAPEGYWALSGALVSYLWSRLTELGIDLVGVAEFIDYPGMIYGASLLDWNTGEPNARYQALKLLLDNFGPGDTLHRAGAQPSLESPETRVHSQGFVSPDGVRKVLLVNKYPEPARVRFADPVRTISTVDTTTGDGPAVTRRVQDGEVELGPFATAVATIESAAD